MQPDRATAGRGTGMMLEMHNMGEGRIRFAHRLLLVVVVVVVRACLLSLPPAAATGSAAAASTTPTASHSTCPPTFLRACTPNHSACNHLVAPAPFAELLVLLVHPLLLETRVAQAVGVSGPASATIPHHVDSPP